GYKESVTSQLPLFLQCFFSGFKETTPPFKLGLERMPNMILGKALRTFNMRMAGAGCVNKRYPRSSDSVPSI
ncbi:hypothetical protein, partial [Heyndrickxia coagulans]